MNDKIVTVGLLAGLILAATFYMLWPTTELPEDCIEINDNIVCGVPL